MILPDVTNKEFTPKQAAKFVEKASEVAPLYKKSEGDLMYLLFTLFCAVVRKKDELIPLWMFYEAKSFEDFIASKFSLDEEFVEKSLVVWLYFYDEGAIFGEFDRKLETSIPKMFLVSKVAQSQKEANDWLKKCQQWTTEELGRAVRSALRRRAGRSSRKFSKRLLLEPFETIRFNNFMNLILTTHGNITQTAATMVAIDEYMERHKARMNLVKSTRKAA